MLTAWENRKGGVPCSSERQAPHTPPRKITWVSDLSELGECWFPELPSYLSRSDPGLFHWAFFQQEQQWNFISHRIKG